MKNKILLILFCLFTINIGVYAQCGQTGVDSGICYTDGSLQAIVIDVCPDNPTDVITIDFTAGSKEDGFDEVVVYSGALGSGTGGTEIYNSSANGTTFAGLSFTSANAGECLSVYINADGSSNCSTNGGVSPVYNTSCASPPPVADCTMTESVSPICTDQPITFAAGINQTAASVTNPNIGYGCLAQSPNPAWYYLEIQNSGTLAFDISNSAGDDVDWAAWGPFVDLTEITSDCGSGAAPFDTPTDCDYTTAASGTINLGTVTMGEVYAVLVTNFGNSPTNISVSTTVASSATTNCAIICDADAGTNNAAASYIVCDGTSISWQSNDDAVLPPPATDSNGNTTTELGYALYNDVPPASPDPDVDAAFSGIFWTGDDYTATNTAGADLDALLTGLTPANITYANNNTVWFVPITLDDGDGDADESLGHDNNGDECFATGTPIPVTYLNPITISNASSGCTWNETITGGAVEFSAFLGTSDMYTYDIIDPNSMMVVNGATTTGVIAPPPSLIDGTYTINVTDDGNGCPTTSFNVTLSSCTPLIDIMISDPCNCTNSIMVGGVTYAQETITITPGTAPYSVTAITGLFDASGTAYTTATATAAISGTTLVGYVPADNIATYTITIADSNGSDDSLTGGPCIACTTPCNADNGTISISGN